MIGAKTRTGLGNSREFDELAALSGVLFLEVKNASSVAFSVTKAFRYECMWVLIKRDLDANGLNT